MKNRDTFKITIVIVVIVVAIAAYFIISSRIDANYTPNYLLEDFVKFPIKNADVNEYKVVKVSAEEMALAYFNRYVMSMVEHPEEAYELLDEESKINIYRNMEWFNRKVSMLTNDYTIVPEFDSYSMSIEDGKTVYVVKDKRNNIYTFRASGIMKYTVTFD